MEKELVTLIRKNLLEQVPYKIYYASIIAGFMVLLFNFLPNKAEYFQFFIVMICVFLGMFILSSMCLIKANTLPSIITVSENRTVLIDGLDNNKINTMFLDIQENGVKVTIDYEDNKVTTSGIYLLVDPQSTLENLKFFECISETQYRLKI
ncbi:hypothetical protein [Thalassotalea sp. PP2-459]|uniref:hypothetical protein n=1 Tax=Thalassotalea sp. PP2-459 TaxID=1742724 RepID=UPI000943BB55|nr:hypothetical protein [Thalassotalea sp. PP2-459]OKY27759.1 hypothetical protein BI291_07535 [Thalassotalea sp. PP2-459]